MEAVFIHEDQMFKLDYGTKDVRLENAPLAADVDRTLLGDGVYLSQDADGNWKIADGDASAYPMVEMKYQYDNAAVEAVTIARGSVTATTKRFNYPTGSPAKGDKLKVVDGILEPVKDDNTEDDLAVAEVEFVFDNDAIRILKLR